MAPPSKKDYYFWIYMLENNFVQRRFCQSFIVCVGCFSHVLAHWECLLRISTEKLYEYTELNLRHFFIYSHNFQTNVISEPWKNPFLSIDFLMWMQNFLEFYLIWHFQNSLQKSFRLRLKTTLRNSAKTKLIKISFSKSVVHLTNVRHVVVDHVLSFTRTFPICLFRLLRIGRMV